MQFIDTAIVAGYLLLMVGLGLWFGRRQSREEFFAASHSMGWLTVGLSVMATLFSSNSFVMYPAAAYGDSLRLSLTLVSHSLIAPLILWVFIPVYSRMKCQTAYEYLEKRYHVSVRCLASGLFILLRIGWMASATFAASLVMANVAGIDQRTVIIGLGVVSVIYTMLGGLRAVMWTDVIQFFVFGATILIALALLFFFQEQRPTEIVTNYFRDRPNQLLDFSPSLTLKYGSWAILIGIFLEALSAFGADQVAVQRYLAAKSERTSQIGFLVNLAGIWLIVPALLLIGVGLFSHYQLHPEELQPLLAEEIMAQRLPYAGENETTPTAFRLAEIEAWYDRHPERIGQDIRRFNLQDSALPQYVRRHFPAGLTGLFLAALMAAIMSSIDSGVHSITTAVIVDFRDRLLPQWQPKEEATDVWIIRGLIVLIGGVTVTLACNVGSLGDVFDIGKKLTAAFGGPLLAVFLLGIFVKSSSTVPVFIATVIGAALTLASMYYFNDWFSVWFWPLGFGIAVVIGVFLSFTLNRFDTSRAQNPSPQPLGD